MSSRSRPVTRGLRMMGLHAVLCVGSGPAARTLAVYRGVACATPLRPPVRPLDRTASVLRVRFARAVMARTKGASRRPGRSLEIVCVSARFDACRPLTSSSRLGSDAPGVRPTRPHRSVESLPKETRRLLSLEPAPFSSREHVERSLGRISSSVGARVLDRLRYPTRRSRRSSAPFSRRCLRCSVRHHPRTSSRSPLGSTPPARSLSPFGGSGDEHPDPHGGGPAATTVRIDRCLQPTIRCFQRDGCPCHVSVHSGTLPMRPGNPRSTPMGSLRRAGIASPERVRLERFQPAYL